MNEQATRIRADFDIRDFGARENIAPATNRAAINAAIVAASAAGGRVIVPPGDWTTGTVELLWLPEYTSFSLLEKRRDDDD